MDFVGPLWKRLVNQETVVESQIANQLRLIELLLNDQEFFRKLMNLFRVCEDLENTDGLHMIFKIVRGIG